MGWLAGSPPRCVAAPSLDCHARGLLAGGAPALAAPAAPIFWRTISNSSSIAAVLCHLRRRDFVWRLGLVRALFRRANPGADLGGARPGSPRLPSCLGTPEACGRRHREFAGPSSAGAVQGIAGRRPE